MMPPEAALTLFFVFALFIILVIVIIKIGLEESENTPPHSQPHQPVNHSFRKLLIRLPPNKINPEIYSDILHSIYFLSDQLVLQISSASSVEVAILCKEEHILSVKRALFGVTESIDVEDAPLEDIQMLDDHEESEYRYNHVESCYISRSPEFEYLPLSVIDDFKEVDPISNLLESVTPTSNNRALYLYIYFRPLSRSKKSWLSRHAHSPSYNPMLYRDIMKRLNMGNPLEVLIVPTLITRNGQAFSSEKRALTSILCNRFTAGYGHLQSSKWQSGNPLKSVPPHSPFFMMTIEELAAIWHPLSNKVSVTGAKVLKFPPTPLPESVTKSTGLTLGTHRQRGEDVTVRLPLEDLQKGHAVLLGKTRVGKTTLGHQMARSIKELAPDSSLIILDPNGDWVYDFAKRSVGWWQDNETYLVDFGNTDFPPSLPLLIPPDGVSIDSFIQTTYETFKLIFRGQISSARMERVLFNTIAVLAHNPGSTLLDFERLYVDAKFRRQRLARVYNQQVIDYWARYDQMTFSQQQERHEPILSRIGVFTQSQALRNITCRKDKGFDIAQLITEGADVLVSTAGADIHAQADLLIEFLIARLHLGVVKNQRPVLVRATWAVRWSRCRMTERMLGHLGAACELNRCQRMPMSTVPGRGGPPGSGAA